jgi:hypothetical protein
MEETNTPEVNPETNGPESQTEKAAPKSIHDLIANIDITDVTLDQIFRELIGSIQQVAVAAQIALGLAERIRLRELAAESTEEAPVVTPELEVV